MVNENEIEDLFKKNKSTTPDFNSDYNWLQIENQLKRKKQFNYIVITAAAILLIIIGNLDWTNQSYLYSDDRFAEIIRLEQQLESELEIFSIDSTQIKDDYRLQIILTELKHINEQIEECKQEIELNPYNPNYHNALLALYKSKRKMIELIKNRG